MIVGGCDIGSTTTKAVVMKDGDIIGSYITRSIVEPEKTSRYAMDKAVRQAGLSSIDDLEYVVGMGHGRLKVMFANETVSEIACHAKGVHYMLPDTRTLIDVGGQDSKMIAVSKTGRVNEFKMNDRCAAGTGKFFEAMAFSLDLELDDIGAPENQGKNPYPISSQCSVFAETEVITLVNEGKDIKDIIAGINHSVASRLCGMVRIIGGLKEKLAFSGGCSKNRGLAIAIESRLGVPIQEPPFDPQLAGAIGAALFAAEKLEAGNTKKSMANAETQKCPRCNREKKTLIKCIECKEIFCENCYTTSSKIKKSIYPLVNIIPRCPHCDNVDTEKISVLAS